MQLARDLLVVKGKHSLDQTGNTRGGFQMTNVGLDRAQPTGLIGAALSQQHGFERIDFNWITERGAGAVGLNIADLGRCHPRRLEGLTDHGLLRQAVGRGQSIAAPILVDRRAGNEG